MAENKMNLCIDIGNTRFKFGLFDGEELKETVKCKKSNVTYILDRILNEYPVDKVIVSTTRKSVPEIISQVKQKVNTYLELSHHTNLPISLKYQTPETLGRDRIASAVGANSIYPDERLIVIDAGTCVTYDFIDKEGVFRGGNISPGIRMRLKAMHEFTANLPQVVAKEPDTILGESTTQALQNGGIRGTIYEIDSFIRMIEKKYGKTTVILTGGDTNYFVDYFKSKIFVVQNLVLIGLNKILQHNA